MTVRVWVDDWQLQCCGEPFETDGRIAWTLRRQADPAYIASVTDDETAGTVRFTEDHHDDIQDAPVTRGTVRRIQVVLTRFAPIPGDDPRTLYPVAGSGTLHDVSTADGYEPTPEGILFPGYIVDVDADPGTPLPSP